MYKISDKKQKLVDEFIASDIEVGELVSLSDEFLEKYPYSGFNKNGSYKVLVVKKNAVVVDQNTGYSTKRPHPVDVELKYVGGRQGLIDIGEDPFQRRFNSVRPVAFDLGSILFKLNILGEEKTRYDLNDIPIQTVNWNPFVYDKDGNKQYYQRDFCWTTHQNQLLIESIYKGINCGTILIRERSWSSLEEMAEGGETELSFNDIVDGKQRLHAIELFINDKYKDLHGNYYSDLSNRAQHDFTNHQLFNYAEMNENCTDEETLYQFLLMNHEGVPQSKEHLDFVSNLLKNVQ